MRIFTSNKLQTLKKQLVIMVLFCIPLFGNAQNILVKGVITDAKTNEPLPGVSILVKGSLTGNISAFDGTYQITVAKNKTLVSVFRSLSLATHLAGSQY